MCTILTTAAALLQEPPTSAAAGSLQQQRLGATNGAAARTAAGSGSGINVVSDNDLFKPKTPQRLGMGAKQQQKKVRRLQDLHT
jgi:hypothetical protein